MTGPTVEDLIAEAWTAVSSGDGGSSPAPPFPVDVTGTGDGLPSRLAAQETAVACVAVALLAASALSEQRGAGALAVTVDSDHVADAVRSERFFTVAGRAAGASFAPLSRFWPAADGWVRTHANYPWHRRALLSALGTSDDVDALAGALARLGAEEIEEGVVAAGGIASAVRTLDAWRAHPQGQALAAEPLIGHRMTAGAPPRHHHRPSLPAAGIRVLDLTRVIAGPVCTRVLGALGAAVVRLDPPAYPDMATGAVADTLLGKRSARLDLGSPQGLTTLHGLLDQADVVVCGYRPGALDRFGLTEESLAERHPGVVAVFLDAWGHTGPWAGRRGFDSVVQGPTGIASAESPTGDPPGALPCQLLDHGTGYLAAAAALDGLRRQGAQGGTHVRRLSLARTAWWLTSRGTRPHEDPASSPTEPDRAPWLVEWDSVRGPVTVVTPPGTLGDRPLTWPFPLTGYADDPAAWPVA